MTDCDIVAKDRTNLFATSSTLNLPKPVLSACKPVLGFAEEAVEGGWPSQQNQAQPFDGAHVF